MSTAVIVDAGLLRQLQEELLALKDEVPGIKLRRSAAHESAAAPFPITLSAAVDPPAGKAERYDVSSLPIVITLHPGVAAAPTTSSAADGCQSDEQQRQSHLASAVELAVPGTELPLRLQQAIARELHTAWASGGPVAGQLHLARIWCTAAERFAELLSLLPELLESYESTDAAGRTVRRFAIVHSGGVMHAQAEEQLPPRAAHAGPGSHAHAEAVEHLAAPPLLATDSERTVPEQEAKLAIGAQREQQAQHHVPGSSGPGSAVEAGELARSLESTLPQLPHALQRELAAVQRRYGAGVSLHKAVALGTRAGGTPVRQLPAGGASPGGAAAAAVEPAGASAAAEALASLRLVPGSETAAAGEAGTKDSSAAICCSVRLQPTDPAWDPATTLVLYCTLIAPAAAQPAAGATVRATSASRSGASVPQQVQVTASVRRPAWSEQQSQEHSQTQRQPQGGLAPRLEQRGVQEQGEGQQALHPPVAGRLAVREERRKPRWQQQQQAADLSPVEAEAFDRLLAASTATPPPPAAQQPHTLPAPAPAVGSAGRPERRPAAHPTARQSGSGMALLGVLRFAENHAGSLLQQARGLAAEVLARRAAAQGAAAEVPTPPSAAARAGSSAGSSQYSDDGAGGAYASSWRGGSAGSDASSSWGSSEEEYSEGEEEGQGVEGGAGHSEAVLAGGTALVLEGLQLADCDALELLKLNLQVRCSRCGQTGDLSFATEAVASGPETGAGHLAAGAECGGCHVAWSAALVPKLVHASSNTLAHLRCHGCQPADVLPSLLAGQCARCSTSAAFRAAAVGRWNERACRRCHTQMRFHFDAVRFAPLLSAGQRRAARAGAQRPGRLHGSGPASGGGVRGWDAPRQPGQPLPNHGTCRHYRHSYRWLRFPCCGRLAPCDLCHEESAADGHEARWATRMVCGFCGVEQPLDTTCRHCAKKLAASSRAPSGRQTKFWEGGKGQRDPSKLDKRDPHRYRGSKLKTRSRKSQRVGEEAKARRDRRQQHTAA